MATVVVSDNSEGITSVDVEIAVGGVNLSDVSSERKAFNVNGREYPMSRFGSWAFQGSDGDEAAKKICVDAGIIATLTWGLRQTYPQVDVWVIDVSRCGLALQMTQDDRQFAMNRIASGQLAKDLERHLRGAIPSLYGNIRIKLIKIMGEASKKRDSSWKGMRCHSLFYIHELFRSFPHAKATDTELETRFNMLREMERISNLTGSGTHELAYARLKELLQSNVTNGDRIQMLLRLGLCCFELNKTTEMADTALRIAKLVSTVRKDVVSFAMFRQDIADLGDRLLRRKMFTLAADMVVAFNPLFRKVEDPNDRIEIMLSNMMMCCVVIQDALRSWEMAGMRMEFRTYIEKVTKDVDYIRNLTGCNPLIRSRAVYYVLYMLGGIEAELGSICWERNSDASSRIESAWPDFRRILSLAEEYPEVAPILSDPGLYKCVVQISENPAMLEKRILDPRIRKINVILNLVDEIPLLTDSGRRLSSDAMSFERLRSTLYDNKNEARKEKQKGNEAYKKKQYMNALEHYDQAIELDASDALLHSNKAAVYICQKRLDEAKSSCLEAMRILQFQADSDDKDIAKVLARLARVEFLSKRYETAMALCRRSLRIHDEPKVRQQMKECVEAFTASRLSVFD